MVSPSVGLALPLFFSLLGVDAIWILGIAVFFVVAILIKRGELQDVADVLDRAWVGILCGIALIFSGGFLAFGSSICPASVSCPAYSCGSWDVMCWWGYQSSNFACQSQQGAMLTSCNFLMTAAMMALQMLGILLIAISVLRVMKNVLQK